MRHTIILLVIYSLLASGVWAAEQTLPKLGFQLNKISEPFDAPDFNLQDMDEITYSLKDFHGKVLLINFWATWCPPCRREMPSMERLYQTMKGTDFIVIAINQFESQDHVYRGFRLLTPPKERRLKDGHVSKGAVKQGYTKSFTEVDGNAVDPYVDNSVDLGARLRPLGLPKKNSGQQN